MAQTFWLSSFSHFTWCYSVWPFLYHEKKITNFLFPFCVRVSLFVYVCLSIYSPAFHLKSYFVSFSLFPFSPLFCCLSSTLPFLLSSQLFAPVATKISSESFFESKMEESKRSEMSCEIRGCCNGELGALALQAVMKGFEDVFSLDTPSVPVLHSDMQVSMQATQNSSKTCSMREGHKLSMAAFSWSDDSDSD